MLNGFSFFLSALKREKVVCQILLNSAGCILIVLSLRMTVLLYLQTFLFAWSYVCRSGVAYDFRFSEFIGTK